MPDFERHHVLTGEDFGRETTHVATFASADGRLSSLVEVGTDSVKPPEKEKRLR